MIYAVGVLIVYFLHVLLKLDWELTLILLLFMLLMLPLHQKRYRQSKEKQDRFFDVSMYLDTLLYAFVKEEKVDLAVRDVSLTLPESKIKRLAEHALEYMDMTFDEVEVLEMALCMIEKEYPCQRIKDVHQFMTHVEYYGGEIEKPVNLLLADKSRWEQRIKRTIAERNKQMMDVILSVAASLLICGAMVYLPIGSMDISKELVVQICALIVIVVDNFIIYHALNYINVDWIQLQLTEAEEYYVEKIEKYQQYDEKKEKKLSYFLGVVGIIATIGAFFIKNEWLTVVLMGLTLFFFQQHKVGRRIAKKNLTKQIQYAFPNWLLDLVLLLQSENVQVALQKSKEHVPGVLRKELFLLTERLEMEPESSAPYHDFLKEFSIPEVHSAMGILYSISIGNSGNADKQISELVEKNLELLDHAEMELLRSSASGLYVLFLLPVVVASFKLIVDMIFMMLYFVQIPML